MRNQYYQEYSCELPTLVELAAARVFKMLPQIKPDCLPTTLIEYLKDSRNSYICNTCERSGKQSDVHFGKPALLIYRLSKRFNNRGLVLPFSFQHCLPCFLERTVENRLLGLG